MKKFLKFIGTVVAIFSAVLGALAVFDRLTQKNRIKDGYLECDVPEVNTEE
ncbi:MAG: hypothetical protein IJY79_04990 [Clostridia bacterium]|nr:hypothetical protein [Clostridia bacterium]